MKLAALLIAGMLTSWNLGAADDVPKPARAADCIKASKDIVACFTGQATFRVMHCKLSVQLGKHSSCNTNGEHDLSDFYAATLKRFAKNKEAQAMTKDYYALWRSSMAAFMTGSPQATRIEAEWAQKGERLELEN